MSACTGGHQNQPIHAGFQRLLGMADGCDVMKDQPAPAMDCRSNVGGRAQAGNDDWNLVFLAGLHVVIKPVVGGMDNLIDGEWGNFLLRVPVAFIIQRAGNPGQPVIKQ